MMKYPDSRKENLVEDKFGVTVTDNYRWMEDETNEYLSNWVDEQNSITQSYLNQIPLRDELKETLNTLHNFNEYNQVRVIGNYIVSEYKEGLSPQNVFYIQKGKEGKKEVLLDPNTLSDDGTVAITLNGHSKDNRYLSYLQAAAGSDWHVIKVIDLETKEVLKDQLEWIKGTYVSWQGQGFYYSAFDAPKTDKVLTDQNTGMKVFYHVLGTDQKSDELIYSDEEHPRRYHGIFTSVNEKALILTSRQGTSGSEVLIKAQGEDAFDVVFPGFNSSQQYFGSKDNLGYFLSDEDAIHKTIISVDLTTLEKKIVLAPSEYPISSCYIIKDKLFVNYLKDVTSFVSVFDLNGVFEQTLELPGLGTSFAFTSSDQLEEVFYGFTSFSKPTTFYQYDLNTKISKEFATSQMTYDTDAYVTEQIFSKSNDGTMIPSFVTYKKGLVMNGNNPTLLYAYGGFNVSLTPFFNPSTLCFLEKGGIYVVANLRGGDEYGEAWHKAGMLLNKQNVFDDFISVAEDLIERKYTSKEKLAISGGSNGGLLIGAVVNQRPDLFAVSLPAVGVMDMLRYHKFTIGWGWAVEYGNPDEEVHFNNLIKYSPLHNIEKKDYPATMVFTADHDDRVVPAHSFKYTARLQELNTSHHPVLIRVDKKSGHGAGKSIDKWIQEDADKYAFILNNM